MKAPEYVNAGTMTQGAVLQHLLDDHQINEYDYDWDMVNVWEIHSKVDHPKTADHTHKP